MNAKLRGVLEWDVKCENRVGVLFWRASNSDELNRTPFDKLYIARCSMVNDNDSPCARSIVPNFIYANWKSIKHKIKLPAQ